MSLVKLLEDLTQLDVDAVRADVAELERALDLGRAILAELERGVADDVRPVLEPVESPRAEPPATPEHSSQPSEPPAASTPPDSTRSAETLADLRAEVLAYYREHPGAWLGAGAVARAIQRGKPRVAQAVRDLFAAGDLEHNGRARAQSRYRAPAPSIADLLEPDVERAVATTTIKPPAATSPEVIRQPGPPVSARTRRAIAAEERDGPRRDEQDLSSLGRDILGWLGRNGSGSAGEIARSMIRNVADVALELKAIEDHNGHLIERRGRGDSGALKYGLSPVGVQQQEGL